MAVICRHVLKAVSALLWWRHQMETFSALLANCAGNSPVTGEFSAQRPVTRSFDVFFDLRLNMLNKRLSKQSWGWWFETLSRSLWRLRNATCMYTVFFFSTQGKKDLISKISRSVSKQVNTIQIKMSKNIAIWPILAELNPLKICGILENWTVRKSDLTIGRKVSDFGHIMYVLSLPQLKCYEYTKKRWIDKFNHI